MRGAATAAVVLALPHFLTRALSPDRFGAWSLMLQITAGTSYLDFGLQTAVARHVARLIERDELFRVNELVNTALAMLTASGVLALSGIGALLWQLPFFFHGIPTTLLPEFRLAASMLAICVCAQLPLSTFSGILIGLHRNEYPALAIGGSRLLGGAMAIAAGCLSHSLIAIALCIGVTSLIGCLLQMVIVSRLLPSLRLNLFACNSKMAKELARYCVGLTVWSFGVFLLNGMDLAVVGHFQYQAVGFYAVATSLITCFVGFSYAIVNAFMTPITALYTRGEFARIRNAVLIATRWTVVISSVLIAGNLVFGEQALTLWVGSTYAHPAFYILKILIVAQAIRCIGAVFCVMLIATGQQHHGIEGAVVEGIVSLCASLAGAIYFGPPGVAIGTLVGTVCGLLWIVTRTMPRAQDVPLTRREFVVDGILRPALVCLPIAVCTLIGILTKWQSQAWSILLTFVVVGCLIVNAVGGFPARQQGSI
jgi:O-antigen/teichoic acid export membrane protein